MTDDGKHGLIIGGPFDGKIETTPEFMSNGFLRGHGGMWHEYSVHERPDGTRFYLYSGSRERLNSPREKH